MDLNKILKWLTLGVLIINIVLEATLAGGAYYTAYTSRRLIGFLWEEVPSIGLGIVSPLSFGIVSSSLVAHWSQIDQGLRKILAWFCAYWLCAWVPFISVAFIVHSSEKLTFPQAYGIYFPDHAQVATLVGFLSIVAANTIMVPALLGIQLHTKAMEVVDRQQITATVDQAATAKTAAEQRAYVRSAGVIPGKIVDAITESGRALMRSEIEMLTGINNLHSHLTRMKDSGVLDNYPGQGKNLMWDLAT